VPCATANAFLVARALLCIAANLTTNELMRPTRFGYLAENFSGSGAGSGGAFLNPFDHGPAANCVQFWRAPHAPDWGDVYQQHAEVGNLAQLVSCERAWQGQSQADYLARPLAGLAATLLDLCSFDGVLVIHIRESYTSVSHTHPCNIVTQRQAA